MFFPELRLMLMMMMMLILFNKMDGVQLQGVSQPNPVVTAGVGENVTLHCSMLTNDQSGEVSWYRQKLGYEPRMIVYVQYTNKNYKNEFQPPKFNFKQEELSINLKIVHVEQSDEAMYYCAYGKYGATFGNGTFLSVKGGEDPKVLVFQSSVQDSVPAGASVTLQCSVVSENRVEEFRMFWFRAAPSQSDPQIIYTHHNSSHQCERVTSTHTCVYNFSKNILSLNDTGTYYCAVALCGKIILGKGTLVQMEISVDPAVIFLSVALGVCVLVIIVLIFILIRKQKLCERHKVRLKQSSVRDKTPNQECDTVELNYTTLHFNRKRGKRGNVKKQQPEDIIYSDVRCSSAT